MLKPSALHIRLSTQAQTLTLVELAPAALEGGLRWAPDTPGKIVMQTSISSSKNGVGQQKGSYQTPLGRHQIEGPRGRSGVQRLLKRSQIATGFLPEFSGYQGLSLGRIGLEMSTRCAGTSISMDRPTRWRWVSRDRLAAFE